MKVINLVGVTALVLGAATVNAGAIVHDLRVKEQVGNSNPQPDLPGKNIEGQVGNFNPQPDPPGKNIIVQ